MTKLPDNFGEKGSIERRVQRADVDFSLGFPFTRRRFGKKNKNQRMGQIWRMQEIKNK